MMPKRKLEEVDSGEDLNSAQSESDDSNCSNGTAGSADVPSSTGNYSSLWILIKIIIAFKVKRFHFHVLDYCQWLRIPDDLICPMMPHKQIELWGITSTSGHIKFKQQTFTKVLKIKIHVITLYSINFFFKEAFLLYCFSSSLLDNLILVCFDICMIFNDF